LTTRRSTRSSKAPGACSRPRRARSRAAQQADDLVVRGLQHEHRGVDAEHGPVGTIQQCSCLDLRRRIERVELHDHAELLVGET